MEVWFRWFSFSMGWFFTFQPFIFQGESGGRKWSKDGRILEERFEDFHWCHWNYTSLVLHIYIYIHGFVRGNWTSGLILGCVSNLSSHYPKLRRFDLFLAKSPIWSIRYAPEVLGLLWDDWNLWCTLQETNISHLEQRKSIDSKVSEGIMLVHQRVTIHKPIDMTELMVGSCSQGFFSSGASSGHSPGA